MSVEKTVELPSDHSHNNDSPDFQGFDVESIYGKEAERYRNAVTLIKQNIDGHHGNVAENISTERHLVKQKPQQNLDKELDAHKQRSTDHNLTRCKDDNVSNVPKHISTRKRSEDKKETEDNHPDETNTFEVTVTTDGVSTSGISSPPIVLDTTSNTLSWGINECSSSFQSVSSCETLESYEPNVPSTDSPQVIVVPFLSDNEISKTMLSNPMSLIRECSIRIDPLKITPLHCNEMSVGKIIELPPMNANGSSECSTKNDLSDVSDDESSAFEGFDVDDMDDTELELYRQAIGLIKSKADEQRSSEPIVIEIQSIEQIVSESNRDEPPPLEPNTSKPDVVKRTRQIQRKLSNQQLSDNQTEANNQSSTEIIEVNVTESKHIPIVAMQDRVFSTPLQNVNFVPDQQEISSVSSGSDSDVIAADVDTSATKKQPHTTPTSSSATKKQSERSADIKNNNKERELRRMEKRRRREELSRIAARIQDQWREFMAVAKKNQRRKERRKRKVEHIKYKKYYRGSKRRRVSCSSDSDSTDSSNSSRTTDTTSSSDSDSYESETTRASDTSYTSQTSYTRTETDSDSSDSDSSDAHRHYRKRFNRRKRSRSGTSNTSDTSSSEDDRRRKFHLMQSNPSYRKQSNSKSDEDCMKSRKRPSTPRPNESPLRKKKRVARYVYRPQNQTKETKNQTNCEDQPKFSVPLSSSPSTVKKVRFADMSGTESTSAGAFSVQQCSFE